MSRIHYFILGLVLIVTAACSGTDNGDVSSEQLEAADAQEIASVEETPRATTATAPKQQTPPPPPAPPQPQYSTLNAGTMIPVRLQDPLSSGINLTGDTFRAIVDEDIQVGNRVLIPRGSLVEGELTFVERSGRVSGRAAMSLQFVRVRVGDSSYALQSEILSFEAEATKKEDATKVGIASGIGAAIGAIAGGGKGAAIGAAVGAGAGGAGVVATRGKEVVFNQEDTFQFTLNESVSIRIR